MAPTTRFSAPSTPSKRTTIRSSTTTESPTSSSSPSKAKASSGAASSMQPISTLPTTIAQTYTHIHALMVAGLYYFHFPALVADPVSTLSQLALHVAVLQGFYMVLCLPVARGESNVKAAAGKRRKDAQDDTSITTKLTSLILSHTLTALASTTILTILTILLGAPLTTHLPQTVLLSLHLALLMTPPLFYTHGVSAEAWRGIVSVTSPFDEVLGAAVGCAIGAWVGAVPIPLDWDREWQKWPVTVVLGAVGGWGVGKMAGGTVGWGRVARWTE